MMWGASFTSMRNMPNLFISRWNPSCCSLAHSRAILLQSPGASLSPLNFCLGSTVVKHLPAGPRAAVYERLRKDKCDKPIVV